jgi:hypothetical protein
MKSEKEFQEPIHICPRQTGKTHMQERHMAVEGLNEEPEEPKKKKKPSEFVEDTDIHEAKLQLLVGLQKKGMYQGTFKGNKEKRRSANKAARAARKKNR